MAVQRRRNAVALAFIVVFLGGMLFGGVQFCGLTNAATSPPPRMMLWAWERPEDLSFIDTRSTGVAYLAATIRWKNQHLICVNRHQPLKVPPSSYLMAVVRIESDGSLNDSNGTQIQEIAMLVPQFLKPGVRAVQFDFDARKSERKWYQNYLTRMRAALPGDLYLSMTSLASWCLGDDWLNSSKLPVDEVVPMFFEMGADSRTVANLLETGNTLGHSFKSVGISDRDASINRILGRSLTGILKPIPRVYMFSRSAWNQEKAHKMIQEVDSWK
jgi:hypothetical protein